jgi:MFS family permease
MALLALRRDARTVGPGLTPGIVAVLALMLLFRLWITYQGSEHRWAVLEIDIPILSGIPLAFLDPVRTVSLGELTPGRLGFPHAGLNFNASTMIWSLGFTFAVVGILWLRRAAREHEDDRVHATILALPIGLATLVSHLLPEEEWSELGLHGLSDRRRQKRIETLVRERMSARQQVDVALQHMDLGSMRIPDPFTGQILEILGRDASPRPPS